MCHELRPKLGCAKRNKGGVESIPYEVKILSCLGRGEVWDSIVELCNDVPSEATSLLTFFTRFLIAMRERYEDEMIHLLTIYRAPRRSSNQFWISLPTEDTRDVWVSWMEFTSIGTCVRLNGNMYPRGKIHILQLDGNVPWVTSVGSLPLNLQILDPSTTKQHANMMKP